MSFSYVDILIVAVQDRRRLFYICLASGGKYDTNVRKAQGVSNARGEERGKKMTQVLCYSCYSSCVCPVSRAFLALLSSLPHSFPALALRCNRLSEKYRVIDTCSPGNPWHFYSLSNKTLNQNPKLTSEVHFTLIFTLYL